MSKPFDIHLPPFTVEEPKPGVRMRGRPVSWGVPYLRAPEVWNRSQGKGVVVFVIDTEDSTEHEAVVDQFLPEYSRRFTNEGPDIETGNGHGLHVADTVLQIAPEANIAFLKALTNEGSGYSSWVASAIKYAADVQFTSEHRGYKRVINLSLGSNTASTVIRDAIGYARGKGVEVFAAAGNDGRDVDFPGAFDDLVITIGAIDENSRPADFSSPGPEVDLGLPGVRINGAWKDGYASLSGTSMATPHAAGVAALIMADRDDDVERVMSSKVVDIEPPGRDDKTGAGVPVATLYFPPVTEPPTEPPTDPDPDPVPDPDNTVPIWVWITGGVVVVGLILYFAL